MRTPEWQAEQQVDAERAARLVRTRFPAMRCTTVEPLGSGWDNTVLLVDGEWAFRFPRRAVAVPALRREIAVLPRLSGRLPLPVPVPELVGEPGEDFPWPFYGARLLAGRELADTALPEDARVDAATAAGRLLRALHGLPTDGCRLPVDPNRRAEPALRAAMARERLDRLAALGLWQPDPVVLRLLRDGERATAPAGRPVLVHGDLHVRHLLVDDAGRAAGVIDWGDVCLADPAADLALAYSAFSGPARAALLAEYGPVGAARELSARVLAVFLSAALAEYAAADARSPLLTEALAGVDRAGR